MKKEEQEKAFYFACQLFEARLLNATRMLLEAKEWFAAAMLCSVAIDVFADARERDDYVERKEYIKALRTFFPLTYGKDDERANKIYSILRSGLVHRLQLEPRDSESRRDQAKVDPSSIVLGAGNEDPKDIASFLVIQVPHLFDSVVKYYEEFKKQPLADSQQRFARRLRQQEYELQDGELKPLINQLYEVANLEAGKSGGTGTTTQALSGAYFPPVLRGFDHWKER